MPRTLLATPLALTLAISPMAAMADPSFEVGTLTCRQSDSSNLVVVSSVDFACKFDPADGTASHDYVATVNKVGLDLSTTQDSTLAWAVLAPAKDFDIGGLAGNYVGASIDASVGVGAGGRVLVGGGEKAIQLQPFAVEGQEGFGAAVGLESFELKAK